MANGETSHGTAKTVAAMEAVVRNTFVQGTLSIIFVVLSLIVITTAIIVTIRSIKAGGGPSMEDPAVASRVFAPASVVATPEEKVIMKEWAESGKQAVRSGH